MSRSRISTTVDETLLSQARSVRPGTPDSIVFDEALKALVTSCRAAELDSRYSAYDKFPIDEPDEWGDLKTFGEAARAT